MSRQKQFNRVGLYMRLSKDDEKAGESVSIEHQRMILQKYVKDHGGEITDEYVDDGYSGTNFERPGLKRMLEDAKTGRLDTILVKDLSRFGRNYIQAGQYIDYIFPAYGIRFIAITDNVDTADRSSTAMDMMPIMNVFNEWHAANTSRKIRAVLEASQRSGKYTSWSYPYGYKAGTDENRTAEIDEEAAAVVRRIFDLRLQGNSYRTIARILTDEGIPNPATYFTRLDGKKIEKCFSPYWCPKTVMWILSNPTYAGRMIQHKTTRVSYKNHKVVNIPENEHIVKENAHEAIVSREIWEKVQAVNRSVSRGRTDKQNKIHALSGLLVCLDCGKKLKIKFARNGESCFVCRTYVDLGKKYCTSHNISEKVLERLVLQDIRSMLKNITFDEQKLKENFLKKQAKNSGRNIDSDEKQLKIDKNRLIELEKLIQSTFEEKVLRKLPESVCISLCEKYQSEKEILRQRIDEAERRMSETDRGEDSAAEYIEKLKHYGKCETLTREMCLQLIDFIAVGEKSADGNERNIQIYYKFSHDENFIDFQKSKLKVFPNVT